MLIVVLIIIGVAVGIWLAMAAAQQTKEQWARAARELGLESEGTGWMDRKLISGRLNNAYVKVDTKTEGSGNTSTTYTRFEVNYPDSRSLRLGLKVTEQQWFSSITQFLGAQDIQLDDPAFDPEFVIRGADPARVREFLNPARRLRIQRLFRVYSGAEIDDTGIHWKHRGVIREANRIVTHVRRLAKTANSLAGVEPEDAPLAQALTAAESGDLESAIASLGQIENRSTDVRALEGELLYTAGRREEAKEVFKAALNETPEDPEVQDWTEFAGATPSKPSPEPVATELSAAEVSDALFDPKLTSLDVNRLFEGQYLDRPVEWSGKLKSVGAYAYDFVFGSETGTKAVVEVYEIKGAMFGGRHALAVLRLPPEAKDALTDRVGETVTFTGTLMRVDGFMKNLYVDNAAIQG